MLSAERLKLINSESDVGKKYGRIEQNNTAGSQGYQAGNYFAFILQTGELFFDEPVTRILGYEHHEVPQVIESWISFIHPDDFAGAMKVVADHLDQRDRGERGEGIHGA